MAEGLSELQSPSPRSRRGVARGSIAWDRSRPHRTGEGDELCRSGGEVFLWRGHLGWLLLKPSWSAGLPMARRGDSHGRSPNRDLRVKSLPKPHW